MSYDIKQKVKVCRMQNFPLSSDLPLFPLQSMGISKGGFQSKLMSLCIPMQP